MPKTPVHCSKALLNKQHSPGRGTARTRDLQMYFAGWAARSRKEKQQPKPHVTLMYPGRVRTFPERFAVCQLKVIVRVTLQVSPDTLSHWSEHVSCFPPMVGGK